MIVHCILQLAYPVNIYDFHISFQWHFAST